jgi:hypothetical protein
MENNNGILYGVEGKNGILQKRFGRYETKTGAVKLLENLPHDAEISDCIEAVYKQIAGNYKKDTDSYSSQNWRFTLETGISDKNASAEKVLEKSIAKTMSNLDKSDWANQVPVASGLAFHNRDTKRSIDLVHEFGKGTFELIELKIASNNPVYAAIEVLVYGIVYVFFRVGGPEENRANAKVGHDRKLLTARKIHLKMIAPTDYYGPYDKMQLKALESSFSDAVNVLARKKIRGISMSFTFEEFPAKKPLINSFLEHRCRI